MDWNSDYITDLIARALRENERVDAASASAIASANSAASGRIIAEQEAVIAGLPLAARVFAALDSRMQVDALAQDGAVVDSGQELLRLCGTVAAILTGQRTALVLLEWLSGIATLTRSYVLEVAGSRAKICCTQKMTPGLHLLEQYAVETGSGSNFGAGSVQIMRITESHTAVAGGVKAALDQAHAYAALRMQPQAMTAYEAVGSIPNAQEANSLSIHVEVRNELELREAVESGADWVTLKNLASAEVRSFVAIARSIRSDCIVEVAGDIALQDAREYAETGANFLAVAALTQSAPLASFRLLVDGIEET
jgi:nicotinate-nucleotide pyrophosphorylase (carboxylating)